MEISIAIKNLNLRYKGADFNAIDNLNLKIYKGEVFGLLGPNGAGKTSLISILTGLISPNQGEISIAGLSLSENLEKIQTLIGVVPQEYALYPKLTAKQNLLFFGSMYGIPKNKLQKRVEKGIEEMRLSDFADKKIETFSGGMKRRINLLAGILHQPKVVFLDEPTVGVDVHSRRYIIDYLTQLNQKGITIIYTSHLLSEAQEFCTRVAIIESGKIQIQGKTKEILMQEGRIKSLEEIFIENTGKHKRSNV